MRPNQPRQKCECSLTFRYPADFQEHKRVGCVVQNGEGESLSADPDAAPVEAVQEVIEPPVAVVSEAPKKSRKK